MCVRRARVALQQRLGGLACELEVARALHGLDRERIALLGEHALWIESLVLLGESIRLSRMSRQGGARVAQELDLAELLALSGGALGRDLRRLGLGLARGLGAGDRVALVGATLGAHRVVVALARELGRAHGLGMAVGLVLGRADRGL